MILRNGRRVLVTAAAAGLLLGGCTRVVARQGFNLDETLVSAIQPGTDNKESVASTLGRPSFTGGVGAPRRDYFSRGTKKTALSNPHPPHPATPHTPVPSARESPF